MTTTAVPQYRPALLRAAQGSGRAVFRCLLALRVDGLAHIPRTGGLIIAGNHASALDGPLVVSVCPRRARALAKSELYGGPAGPWLHRMGQIPVHRGHPDRSALSASLAVLRAGGVLAVFPEGTRGTGDLTEVQHGLAYLVLKSGAPVIPVACLGTGTAMPRGRRLPVWRSPVRVVFGPPVPVDLPANPRARSAVAATAEQLRIALADHLDRARGQERAA